jgi:hypothetical protein
LENEDGFNEEIRKDRKHIKMRQRNDEAETRENTIIIVIPSVKLILPYVRCLAFPGIWILAFDNWNPACTSP